MTKGIKEAFNLTKTWKIITVFLKIFRKRGGMGYFKGPFLNTKTRGFQRFLRDNLFVLLDMTRGAGFRSSSSRKTPRFVAGWD